MNGNDDAYNYADGLRFCQQLLDMNVTVIRALNQFRDFFNGQNKYLICT